MRTKNTRKIVKVSKFHHGKNITQGVEIKMFLSLSEDQRKEHISSLKLDTKL